MSTPGVPASTRNIDMRCDSGASGWVTASTMKNAALAALEEKNFQPSSIQPSPSRVAVVRNSPGSEPPWGSVIE